MFPNMEYIKTLVNGLKTAANSRFLNLEKWVAEAKTMLSALWSNRPNWLQDDPAALDYVEGRTHYTCYEEELRLNGAHAFPLRIAQRGSEDWPLIADGDTVRVEFDGVSYACKAVYNPEDNMCYFGSGALLEEALGKPLAIEVGSDEPFFGCCMINNGGKSEYVKESGDLVSVLFGINPDGNSHAYAVYHVVEKVKQLDQKYVPNADWNAAEGETGHVLNRTHYVEDKVLGVAMPGETEMAFSPPIDFTDTPIIVEYNGIRYRFESYSTSSGGPAGYVYYYGNSPYNSSGAYPFAIFYPLQGGADNSKALSSCVVVTDADATVRLIKEHTVPLDRKFVPDEVITVTTEGTGSKYTATHEGFKKSKGMLIKVIPHVANNGGLVSLNLNKTGAVYIKRRVSGVDANYVNPGAGMLYKEGVFLLWYTGTCWEILGAEQPSATDLNGTVPVSSGGTGLNTIVSGSYLVGNGADAVSLKTPAEVLEDIGAIPKPATAEVGQLLAVKAVDDAGVPTEWDVVDIPDQTILASPSGTKYRITVGDDGTLTTTAVTE